MKEEEVKPKFLKGETLKIVDHPDKSMIGQEVTVLNSAISNSHKKPDGTVVNEKDVVYKVVLSSKKVWAPESSLARIK